MDKNKKEIIGTIIDGMKQLNLIVKKTYDIWGADSKGEGIDEVFTIGYKTIPMILGEEESDYLDDLFYDYTAGDMSKKEYFKLLEAYIEEEK